MVIMNSTAFHSKKCPGLDAKSYGHSIYGRVHHTSFSRPAIPPLGVWALCLPKAFLYEGSCINHCIQKLWAHSEGMDTSLC